MRYCILIEGRIARNREGFGRLVDSRSARVLRLCIGFLVIFSFPFQVTALRPLFATRDASTLVLVEHDNNKLSPSSLHAVTAAKKLGGDITCLVAGTSCESVSVMISIQLICDA